MSPSQGSLEGESSHSPHCYSTFTLSPNSSHSTTNDSPQISRNGCLSLLYYNARSLYSKMDELATLCSLHHPEIVCIVETWLSEDVLDSEISIPNYATIRHDCNRHGGGILFLVHNSLSYKVIVKSPSLEFMLLSVTSNVTTSKLNIGLFYRPPSSAVQVMDDFYDCLQSLDITYFSNLIVLGIVANL